MKYIRNSADSGKSDALTWVRKKLDYYYDMTQQ